MPKDVGTVITTSDERLEHGCKAVGAVYPGIWKRAGGQGFSPEEFVLRKEQQEQVRAAVAGLEDRYRIPVYLYYTLQLSTSQIGRILKLPQGTVKSRLHKARQLLRQELEVVFNEA